MDAFSAQKRGKILIQPPLVATIMSRTLKIYQTLIVVNLEPINMLVPLRPALTSLVSPIEMVTMPISSRVTGSQACLPTWVEPCNAMGALCPVAPNTVLQLSGEDTLYFSRPVRILGSTRLPFHWSGNSSLALSLKLSICYYNMLDFKLRKRRHHVLGLSICFLLLALHVL